MESWNAFTEQGCSPKGKGGSLILWPAYRAKSRLRSFPASGSFRMSWLLTSRGQSIEASASASVLPMNIQGRFPLGLTSLICLMSKGLSRVFSSTTIQKHLSFIKPSPTLTSIHDYWESHSFDYMDFCWQNDGDTMETVSDFTLGGSKITADGDCSMELKDSCSLEEKLWPT